MRRDQISEPLHTKKPIIILLVGITVVCAQTTIFSAEPCYKMWESQQLLLGLRLVKRICEETQQSAIQTKIEHHFGGFFQQMKGRQPIGRKDSKQTVLPINSTSFSFQGGIQKYPSSWPNPQYYKEPLFAIFTAPN